MSPRSETSSAPSPEGPPQPLAKFGCLNCRKQHLKCDRALPACGRCQNLSRECRFRGLKIRVTTEQRFKFEKKQKWVKMPSRLVFIDETKPQMNGDLNDDDIPSPESLPEDAGQVASAAVLRQPPSLPSLSPLTLNPQPQDPGSPTDRFLSFANTSRSTNSAGMDWPLTNVDEGRLLRHFIERLATWLDLCDPRQSFKTVVPERAATKPALFYAILALAGQHLSHLGEFSNTLAVEYNSKCVRFLANELEAAKKMSPERFLDEDLFAATIILRVYEEMEPTLDRNNRDAAYHILGIRGYVDNFVKDGNSSLVQGSLSAASFWVGLRQEIYIAVMSKTPIQMNLVSSLVDRSTSGADGCTWANRAVVHCADVLNYCFGRKPRDPAEWGRLKRWNEEWLRYRESTWVPTCVESDSTTRFPEIQYLQSWQAIGAQHHLLAEIFLLSIQAEGRVIAITEYDRGQILERIQSKVREICCIGLGNQWTPPSMFTACMAIAAFGDYFHDPYDQEVLFGILVRTECQHARPTQAVQRQMKAVWGWERSG